MRVNRSLVVPVLSVVFGLASAGCSAGDPLAENELGTLLESEAVNLADVVGNSIFVDLTYPFDEETIYWPTADGFEFIRGTAGYTEAGFYYEAHSFAAAEHGGTHLDAPIHFFEGADAADEIKLKRLIGEGLVVDVSTKCVGDPDCQITVEDLIAWEESQNRALTDCMVLLKTGWGQYWPDRERSTWEPPRWDRMPYRNCTFLASTRMLLVGWRMNDRFEPSVSIRPASTSGSRPLFESHVELFSRNIPVFENVANLEELPASGFVLIALPMKIRGGSGGPLRIVAQLPGQNP